MSAFVGLIQFTFFFFFFTMLISFGFALIFHSVCDTASRPSWVSPHWHLLHSRCVLFLLFSTSHIKKSTSTPLPSLLTPALISSLGCCSGSLLSAGLHAALLTFFTASNFRLYSLSPRSHGASRLHCVIWSSPAFRTSSFHTRSVCVCRPGENTVGGRELCK